MYAWKRWNLDSKSEVTEGDPVYADKCCMSSDRRHVGLLRRRANGRVCHTCIFIVPNSGVATGGDWGTRPPTCPKDRLWDSSRSDEKLVRLVGGTTLK